MVARESLDSDRVNFLIWRYLLEGNYRETAAKFQKEWQVTEPHRELPFAQHVKGHALVSVINRGLIYNALERDHARQQAPQNSAADLEALQVGIFGPLNAQAPAKVELHDEPRTAADEEMEMSRKRPHQPLQNGSPAKRPRLSNGYENGPEPPAHATTPMEVDGEHHPHLDDHQQDQVQNQQNSHADNQADNHAYPSPLEGEQGPPTVTHTDGPEQGTQVDKVDQLLPETTFIRLMDEPRASEAQTPAQSPSSAHGAENAPILLQCEWNPRDPSILAAAGTDALARVWTVSRATASEPARDHVFPHALALLDTHTPRTTTVTALSWASDGNSIALATDSGTQATISVWSVDGTHLAAMEVAEPPVLKLSWNPNNTALLAIAPDKGGALVTVYYSSSGNSVSYFLPGHDLAAQPLDATWTNDTEFLLTGGDVLLSLRCTETSIVQARKFETKPDDSFTHVLFDWRSRLAATASDKGVIDLWDETGQRRSISAHQGAITTIMWQPLPQSQSTPDDERLIASGGDDCAILLWNARKPEAKARAFLTMDSPIVRLAFTPDGTFIAGATSSQVLIWKVGSNTMPRASWSRPAHPGWLSPRANSESDEEDEHCLCWDADGQKLAYGSNSRLAVINFSR